MTQALLKSLAGFFSRRDKRNILFLVAMSIAVSLIETVGVSAVMVFVSIATNFDAIFSNKYFNTAYNLLGLQSKSDFVVLFGIALLCFYIFRMMTITFHAYCINRFSYMRQRYLSVAMFEKFLLFRYRDYVDINPGKIRQIILTFTGNVAQVVAAMLNILAESFTVLCIYAMLFYVNWKMTLALTLFFSLKLVGITTLFSRRIRAAGNKTQVYTFKRERILNESYGNYKFLKLLSLEQNILNDFEEASNELAKAGATNAVWQQLPRYLFETVGFSILISVIVYVVFMYRNASSVMPIVSMYALAFYRFLPSINKIMISYNQIQFNQHGIKPIQEFLGSSFEALGEEDISFNQTIELKDVTFQYTPKSIVLKNASLTLDKGDCIGFVGESGAGKSTLADLVMGLLSPQEGSIAVDKASLNSRNLRAWRKKIGYIPQGIYLFDGTVADNVVCGRSFDEGQIVAVLKRAKIYDFLMTKEGIHTLVGEGGLKFSGGQMQRVAIARALYNNPEVLVLDEATSALDNQTEEGIMNEVYDLSSDKTLIVIAHRLSTIERCDKVYKIEHGKITDVTGHYSKTAQASVQA